MYRLSHLAFPAALSAGGTDGDALGVRGGGGKRSGGGSGASASSSAVAHVDEEDDAAAARAVSMLAAYAAAHDGSVAAQRLVVQVRHYGT